MKGVVNWYGGLLCRYNAKCWSFARVRLRCIQSEQRGFQVDPIDGHGGMSDYACHLITKEGVNVRVEDAVRNSSVWYFGAHWSTAVAWLRSKTDRKLKIHKTLSMANTTSSLCVLWAFFTLIESFYLLSWIKKVDWIKSFLYPMLLPKNLFYWS